MICYPLHRRLALLLCIAGTTPVAASAQDSAQAAGTLLEPLPSNIPWGRYARDVVRLYQLGSDLPIWLQGDRLSAPGQAAVQALLQAGEQGLDPRDYDADKLDSLARSVDRARLDRIDCDRFDAQLTVDFIRYLDDLQFGRLHPRSLDRSRSDSGIDLPVAIRAAIDGDSIAQLVTATAPQLAQYRNLRHLLVRYRRLAEDSSLRPVSWTAPVGPIGRYQDLAILRKRLAAVGDLEPVWAGDLSAVYTSQDAKAVQRFQRRHGLPPTGVLDSLTAVEINTPFSWRARQIELALERLRWLPPIGRQRFLVVNVPAFQLFAFDSTGGTGAPALSMRVIVGNALDTRTPVLFERMRYVDFRPYWSIPLSITVKEVLPLVRKDPNYLKRNHMEIVARKGRVVDSLLTPELIDRIAAGELYLRQKPGGQNPLGLVKFVFPNAASVYLHGTPRPDLFEATRRDFSHGCIRVQDPTALALWVLQDQPTWNKAAITAAEQGKATVRVPLSRPMPVVVWYTTAVAAPNGEAWFYSDIYGHDRALQTALHPAQLFP
ncbi:MAG TPA: L,D-transpeptidase family protein [Gemmatimonadales bacterium]|nr:L,D-transpeptidase family protein [Gemmatimonadales bacterium]